MAPAIVAVALLLAIAGWAGMTRQSLRTSSGSPVTFIIDPPLTRLDVERIAAGIQNHPPGSLARSLLRYPTFGSENGRTYIFAGFVEAPRERNKYVSFGWPSAWYSRHDRSVYRNAILRDGFQPMQTDLRNSPSAAGNLYPGRPHPPPRPRWSLNGSNYYGLAYRPPVEETGGVEIWIDIALLSIVSTFGLIALGWMATSAVIWLVNVATRRARRWRGRPLKWGITLIVVCFVAFGAFDGVQSTDFVYDYPRGAAQQRTSTGIVYHTNDAVTNTGLTLDEVRSLASDPAGDQVIADALLRFAPLTSSDLYLGVDFTPEALMTGMLTNFGGSLFLFTKFDSQLVRRPDIGESVPLTQPRGWNASVHSGFLFLQHSSGDPQLPIRAWQLNLNSVGAIAVAIWLAWLLTRLICRFIVAITVRRRRARGRCIACGYFITAPKPA